MQNSVHEKSQFNELKLQYEFFVRYLFSTRSGAVIRTMARISSIATLIGIFSLITISSIMNGFNKTQSGRLLNIEPHLLIQNVDEKNLPDLERATVGSSSIQKFPFLQHDVILRSLDGKFTGAVAKGLPSDQVYDFLGRASQMRYLLSTDEKLLNERPPLDPRDILIGEGLANKLNLIDGDELMIIPPETLLGPTGEGLSYERVRVKRVFGTDFPEIDNNFLFYPLSKINLKFQSTRSGIKGFELRFSDASQIEVVAKKLRSDLKELEKVNIETWKDRNQALFMALRLEKTAMLLLLSLGVLITCFSLITVITMLISQKKKDIQLLLAIGLSRKKTERLFMRLGLALCCLGLVPGLVMGVIVSLLIEKYPIAILPDIYYDSAIPSQVSYTFVGFVAIGCLLLAWVTAKIPVTEAARKTVNSSFSRG